MPKANEQIEIQIEQALNSLSEQSKPNITKTTREFAVSEGRLQYRLDCDIARPRPRHDPHRIGTGPTLNPQKAGYESSPWTRRVVLGG
ncbi:hypothetical protein N7472_000379 [Penicillium cf. griseofulvum]|uniref:Uncharacterized protein n=1 Tax=Penicillium cf. griseofulvum TaxID=2972120 RepID=A0A9W9MZJ0_9EURO|nr:hypothetical protein N7472_000379 [Penicillium cf. griseofulvum]KAJ5424841.1 hypothetical protein N7445_010814 [Penicillium cf. griseofulvum]